MANGTSGSVLSSIAMACTDRGTTMNYVHRHLVSMDWLPVYSSKFKIERMHARSNHLEEGQIKTYSRPVTVFLPRHDPRTFLFYLLCSQVLPPHVSFDAKTNRNYLQLTIYFSALMHIMIELFDT